jgi:SAM-dependent methyltransferase
VSRFTNEQLTGDPGRSWLDDLVARGRVERAAALGCEDDNPAAAWLRARGSERLDVYELSPGMIRRTRAGIRRGARFICADLNFARLPAERYDVIWSSGTLHHIVNLEHLLDEVARALRPGGLFALHDYVGETRHRFAPERLARVNLALREVPARFRRNGIDCITPPPLNFYQGAFCAIRSAEILPLARARFEVVHEGRAGALYPLFMVVDLPALAREAPAVLDRVLAAEAEALRDPAICPTEVYAVFRRRRQREPWAPS